MIAPHLQPQGSTPLKLLQYADDPDKEVTSNSKIKSIQFNSIKMISFRILDIPSSKKSITLTIFPPLLPVADARMIFDPESK